MFIAKSCTVTVSVMAWVEENVASPVVTKENVQFFFFSSVHFRTSFSEGVLCKNARKEVHERGRSTSDCEKEIEIKSPHTEIVLFQLITFLRFSRQTKLSSGI